MQKVDSEHMGQQSICMDPASDLISKKNGQMALAFVAAIATVYCRLFLDPPPAAHDTWRVGRQGRAGEGGIGRSKEVGC